MVLNQNNDDIRVTSFTNSSYKMVTPSISVTIDDSIYLVTKTINSLLYDALVRFHRIHKIPTTLTVVSVTGKTETVIVPANTAVLLRVEAQLGNNLRLMYDGQLLDVTDTAISLDMNDRDSVDCVGGWK